MWMKHELEKLKHQHHSNWRLILYVTQLISESVHELKLSQGKSGDAVSPW